MMHNSGHNFPRHNVAHTATAHLQCVAKFRPHPPDLWLVTPLPHKASLEAVCKLFIFNTRVPDILIFKSSMFEFSRFQGHYEANFQERDFLSFSAMSHKTWTGRSFGITPQIICRVGSLQLHESWRAELLSKKAKWMRSAEVILAAGREWWL